MPSSLESACDILPRINPWTSILFLAFTRRLPDPLVVLHGSHPQSETKVPASAIGACDFPAQQLAAPRDAEAPISLSRFYCFNRFFIGEVVLQAFASAVPQLSLGKQIHPTYK
jgi:hypothetical protein